MTFLAPWALVMGAAAALGTVLLHLVARQRAAAFVLPTARFVPDQRTLVSRAASTPRDLLLLAIRVLLLLAASAAFAHPVLVPHRSTRARIVLLDRSAAVASVDDAMARMRALVADGVPTRVIAFDSIASAPDSARVAETAPQVARADARSSARGSISAALLRALRVRETITDADSVELALISPVAESELDAATDSIRRLWPAAIRLERLGLRAPGVTAWRMEGVLRAGDPLAPSVASVSSLASVATAGAGRTAAVPTGPVAVSRLVRGAPSAADSAFARGGGTLIQWSDRLLGQPRAEGLAAGDDVIVALLGRVASKSGGRIAARWADGTAAAVERTVGDGCVRDIGVAVPAAGELPLHPAFQRIVRGLLAPCGVSAIERPADSASVARLVARALPAMARTSQRSGADVPSPIVRWLLALALALAVGELLVRRVPPRSGLGTESA